MLTHRAPGAARAGDWLAPAALAFFLSGSSVRATPFRHGMADLAAIGLLYLLLALAVHAGLRFARRAGKAWHPCACLAAGLVPAAQLRLDAERLVSSWSFCAAVVVFGLGYEFLSRIGGRGTREDRRFRPARELAPVYGALVLLVLGVAAVARSSAEARWHLLKHHRLLGTPLYYLASPPVSVARNALWDRRGQLRDPREEARATSPSPGPSPDLSTGRAHIVFVMLDTLRADALAAYGGRPDVMPGLDALAARSAVFTDLRANASWTRASCASIFTGLLPEEHGAARFHERLSDSWATFPELLHGLGYQTAAFVANWLQVGIETGFAQGFEVFRELMSTEEFQAAGKENLREAYARAERVNGSVLEWLEAERDPGRPLLLYLHYLDPHAPYLEPPEPGGGGAHERKRGLYRQQLRYLDRQLSLLLARLEELLDGPTVLLITSDHGEEFWDHDEWGHGHSLYRELVWVPLLVCRPGGRAERLDSPLESRDLYELVLALARAPELDLETWADAHRRALRYSSQYLDRAQDARPDRKWTGLRRVDAGGYALIWSAFGPSFELYDCRRDPLELENRLGEESERAVTLRAAMERAVRYWSASARVVRSDRDLAFLRALGYAGGVEGP